MDSPPCRPPSSDSRDWFKYFQFEENRDSPNDVRNILLIVSTLIAAVTFQAGVNPPGGVWQDTNLSHVAGTAIYASQNRAYYVFLISNTMAFTTSILVIMCLTYRFPFYFEIWGATATMMITYASSVFAVSPDDSVRFRYVMVAGAIPFMLRFLIHMFFKYWTRKTG